MRPQRALPLAVVTSMLFDLPARGTEPPSAETPAPAVSTTTVAGRGYRSLDGMPVGIPGFGVPGAGPKRDTPEPRDEPVRDDAAPTR